MSKLYLKLKNEDGSFREFRKDRVSARWVKEGIKHSKKVAELEKKNDGEAVIDERLNFVCEVFGNSDLTPDAILDGLESEDLIPTLDKVFRTVMGNGEEQTDGPEK